MRCLCLFSCLFLISCATTFRQPPKNAFERFRILSKGTEDMDIRNPKFLLEGSEAQRFLLSQIASAGPQSIIEIRQFYVRRGVETTQIHDHLKKKLASGTRITLQLDFMFSVSALKIFDDLKVFKNFELQIMNPPSPDFLNFTVSAYNLKNPDEVIDHIIDSDLESLRKSLKGSKLEGAVDQDIPSQPPPEILLGAVMKRVMSVSGVTDKLRLGGHMKDLSKRFHDKIFTLKTGPSESHILGGRGWADSFAADPRKQKNNQLTYIDIEMAFEKARQKDGSSHPAVAYFAKSDYVRAARDFEDNLVALVQSSQRSLEIYTPYFTPTPRIRAALAERASRGVKISIYTNSLENSDVPVVAAYAYENMAYWARDFGEGFEFYTFNHPKGQCYHGKLVIVDRELVWIGSGNWDFRSFALDSNSFVAVDFSQDTPQKPMDQLLIKLADSNSLKWHKWSAEEISHAKENLLRFFGSAKLNEILQLFQNDSARIQL